MPTPQSERRTGSHNVSRTRGDGANYGQLASKHAETAAPAWAVHHVGRLDSGTQHARRTSVDGPACATCHQTFKDLTRMPACRVL